MPNIVCRASNRNIRLSVAVVIKRRVSDIAQSGHAALCQTGKTRESATGVDLPRALNSYGINTAVGAGAIQERGINRPVRMQAGDAAGLRPIEKVEVSAEHYPAVGLKAHLPNGSVRP